jgi:Holliday junction DNA helicase RuvA
MYAYLDGLFTWKSPALVHVDVQGVGYEVNISLHTSSQIQGLDKGRLYTYLQVKEDSHTLFGFAEQAEKELFIQLIGVTGIGAATARMMLSKLKPEEIVQAISQGNIRVIESVKGIGKKTAERLVLELKDRMSKQVGTPTWSNTAPVGNTTEQDALNALQALGISRNLAETAIKKIITQEPDLDLELLIKKALKAI